MNQLINIIAGGGEVASVANWGHITQQVFGRGHVVFVHFPIALLIVAAAIEVGTMFTRRVRRSKTRGPSRVALWVAVFGGLAAAFAAWSGWTYAAADLVDDARVVLFWHRWVGVVTAGIGVITIALGVCAIGGTRPRVTRAFRFWLLTGAALVGLSSHFGGVMVHGSDHVLGPIMARTSPATLMPGEVVATPTIVHTQDVEPKPDPKPVRIVEVAQTPHDVDAPPPITYTRHVQPILEARCYRCHGAMRQRARLRLDQMTSLVDAGKLIIPGDASSSELIRRITLAADHVDRMPPDDPPLSRLQIDQLTSWIDAGADLNRPPAAHVTCTDGIAGEH